MATTRLSKPDFFMSLAVCAARRSNDPTTRVGACIVKNERVVSLGYNGMTNHFYEIPSAKGRNVPDVQNRLMYDCHAEMNAIVSSHGADLHGTTMYVTHNPCNVCANMIVQCKLKDVFYLFPFEDDTKSQSAVASRVIFEKAKIPCTRLTPKIETIVLNLRNPDLLNKAI